MGSSEDKPPFNMEARPSKPINLTAAAEPMQWAEACKLISVSGPSEVAALEVRGLTNAEKGRQNDGSREALYIVTAGFGVLRCDDVDMECTAGDLLFVPRGCPHRFERLDGEIKIWRISPGSPTPE
jgi:mannose-6-phosphate isomerase-like protein (cupin superfamily)